MKKSRLLLTAALLAASTAHAEYFLDLSQKGQVIARGQITGRDDALYDIWVIPGYVSPAKMALEGWKDAGSDLSEYGEGDLYHLMAKTGRGSLKFASHDAIRDFAFKGSADAWVDAFDSAAARTRKRVFGWWFAYPWAVIEATGESAFRMVVGVPGGILVGGLGTTVAPAAEFLWPAGKSIYHAVIPGTVLPVTGASWNTVISPPMALIGQQPNADRADGFWVKRMEPIESDDRISAQQSALANWADSVQTYPDMAANNAAHEAYVHEHDEQFRKIREASERELMEHNEQYTLQRSHLMQDIIEKEPPVIDRELLQELVNKHGRTTFVNTLMVHNLSREDAEALLDKLLVNPNVQDPTPTQDLRPDNKKTTPLQRSIELMRH